MCFITPKSVHPFARVVRRFVIASVFFALLFVAQSFCQSGAVNPQGGAGHAAKASCVILKRMGPADEITSRLYSFGFRGKQFQYVEGKLPEGLPFHGRLTDHDVRNLQARGAEVIVLNPTFKSEELMQARADCQAETGKAPNQADAKATPPQAPTAAATPPAPATEPEPVKLDQQAPNTERQATAPPVSNQLALQATLEITSNPAGADISVDGNFVGDTPSELAVAAGVHTITISRRGYKPWERKLTVSSGKVTVVAELEQ